jgi:hypothetical protein
VRDFLQQRRLGLQPALSAWTSVRE